MNQSLSGRHIAMLATDGVEQIQLAWPWEAMLDAGANVELVAPDGNGIQGFNHREQGFIFPVDKPLREALARDYDALVLPGGVGCSEALAADTGALRFLREFRTLAKPVAAICQAPSVLAQADDQAAAADVLAEDPACHPQGRRHLDRPGGRGRRWTHHLPHGRRSRRVLRCPDQ